MEVKTSIQGFLPGDKRPYVYALAYPESMGGRFFYIGKGAKKRIIAHEREAKQGVKSHKCNIIRKIHATGEQVVKIILAYFETEQEAFLYEVSLIFLMDGLTNLTNGGEGISGLKHSEETRRKMSDFQKGKPKSEEHRRKLSEKVFSEEHRRKLSEAQKGKPGKPHSEETRRKMSKIQKGRIVSEEARRKSSEAQKGKPRLRSEAHQRKLSEATSERNRRRGQSEETRRKIGEANRGKSHKPFSEEHRRKIGEALKGKPKSEEARRKSSEAYKRRVEKSSPFLVENLFTVS